MVRLMQFSGLALGVKSMCLEMLMEVNTDRWLGSISRGP